MDLLGLLRCKPSIASALKRPTYKKMICFFPTLRWCAKLICLFMSHSFFRNQGGFIFSRKKRSTPARTKQRLERRMLRDRCKTCICDHLFQELPQNANGDLQNPQVGRSSLIKRCFGYLCHTSQELCKCLGVVQ